jgi:hypothetical protein
VRRARLTIDGQVYTVGQPFERVPYTPGFELVQSVNRTGHFELRLQSLDGQRRALVWEQEGRPVDIGHDAREDTRGWWQRWLGPAQGSPLYDRLQAGLEQLQGLAPEPASTAEAAAVLDTDAPTPPVEQLQHVRDRLLVQGREWEGHAVVFTGVARDGATYAYLRTRTSYYGIGRICHRRPNTPHFHRLNFPQFDR